MLLFQTFIGDAHMDGCQSEGVIGGAPGGSQNIFGADEIFWASKSASALNTPELLQLPQIHFFAL